MQVLCNIRTRCPHPLNRGVHRIQVHFTVNSEQWEEKFGTLSGVRLIQVSLNILYCLLLYTCCGNILG